MWNRMCLVFIAIGFVYVLIQIDNTEAIKCYYCQPRRSEDTCPNDGRGELQTCTEPGAVCYKFVKIQKRDPPHPQRGESRTKGCRNVPFGPKFNMSYHPGCQPYNEFQDLCTCTEDRCNDEGTMIEYLAESD